MTPFVPFEKPLDFSQLLCPFSVPCLCSSNKNISRYIERDRKREKMRRRNNTSKQLQIIKQRERGKKFESFGKLTIVKLYDTIPPESRSPYNPYQFPKRRNSHAISRNI